MYKKDQATQAGEIGLGTIFVIILVVLFIIWVLTGGPNSKNSEKPFITPATDETPAPIQPYTP